MSETVTPAAAGKKGRQTKIGRVISDKMDKTVVVEVEVRDVHPRSQENNKRRSRFAVHDEKAKAAMGDRVAIEETRPLSKRKRWTVREVLRKAEA